MPAKRRGFHQRTIDKIHLVIRLELANPMLNNAEVAQLAGLSVATYARIKTTPYYKTIHRQYLGGVLGSLDTKVSDSLKITQDTLDFAVPIAMQTLVQQALSAKDDRVRNKACNDILDRDGHFAKVSRVGLANPDQGGVGNNKDNEVASQLISAMAGKPVAVGIDSPPATETTQ